MPAHEAKQRERPAVERGGGSANVDGEVAGWGPSEWLRRSGTLHATDHKLRSAGCRPSARCARRAA